MAISCRLSLNPEPYSIGGLHGNFIIQGRVKNIIIKVKGLKRSLKETRRAERDKIRMFFTGNVCYSLAYLHSLDRKRTLKKEDHILYPLYLNQLEEKIVILFSKCIFVSTTYLRKQYGPTVKQVIKVTFMNVDIC